MASTKGNLISDRSSWFYGKENKKEKNSKTMNDDFYKQAAVEVINDEAKKRKEMQSKSKNTESPKSLDSDAGEKQEEVEEESYEQPYDDGPQSVSTSSNIDDSDFDDFDFVEAYDESQVADDLTLPENTARSAISCGFIGVGGGGGKLAKSFLDLGFSRTLLINTTEKDQPDGVAPENFLLLPGADGVGKDISLGKRVLENNSASVEDAIRTRLGTVDWLFVMAGGGGGTGSACHVLHESFSRYLKSANAQGQVVYIVTKPSSQELLNPTISSNFTSLLEDVSPHPHILIDNEKQLQLLRGKVGMLDLYPSANRNFAKLLHQVLKLADESSPIQSFDSKDLEKCLNTPGRMLVGSTVVRDFTKTDLGALLYQGCVKASPCTEPKPRAETGVMLLVATPEMANDPSVSKKLESAFSYVGGRTSTLFSGVYVKNRLPGLIAITILGGM
jgi:cell division GTPase FtsZ